MLVNISSTAKNIVFIAAATFFSFYFSACHTKDENAVDSLKNYSIYIMGNDNKEYLVQTDSLTKGVIEPEKEGTILDLQNIGRNVIVKHGFYYYLNRKKNLFVKYKMSDKNLIKVDSLEVKGFSAENFHWAGKDTLLLTGLQRPDFNSVKYIIIKINGLAIISQGFMEIPKPSGIFTSMSVGFVNLQADKILVGYTYHHQLGSTGYTTSDTAYISTLKYPEMKALNIDKDVRSTFPGGVNLVQSYSFIDEKQDFYFMTCPGIALGNRPDRPTGIFRIKKGEDHSDKQYFFDISAAVKNHAYGLWYLGKGRAIIRSERKDLFRGLSDHYSTAHFEFYLLDLATKQIKKLQLPLDKGTRKECVIVKDNIAYIAINSAKEGNFIWMYNIGNGTLKKGLQLDGVTDFILRIDKL